MLCIFRRVGAAAGMFAGRQLTAPPRFSSLVSVLLIKYSFMNLPFTGNTSAGWIDFVLQRPRIKAFLLLLAASIYFFQHMRGHFKGHRNVP